MAFPPTTLHIGHGKTGTTAIQSFLAANRARLRANGTLYPDVRHKGAWSGVENHNHFAWSLIDKTSWLGFDDVEFCRQFHDQCTDKNAEPPVRRMILSAESFTGEPLPWTFESPEAYFNAQRMKLARLRRLFADTELTILVYLRPQDAWVDSVLNQTVKFEGLFDARVVEDVPSFLTRVAPRLDYAQTLDLWHTAFPASEIIVRPFETAQLTGGDAVMDLLDVLGEDPDGDWIRPTNEARSANTRLSPGAFAYKLALNARSRPKWAERQLAGILQRFSNGPDRSVRDASILSPGQRSTLISRYAASNSDVARRYLARPDGRLFHALATNGGDQASLIEPHDSGEQMTEAPSVINASELKAVEIPTTLDAETLAQVVAAHRYYNGVASSLSGRLQALRLATAEFLRKQAPWLHAVARRLRDVVGGSPR